MKKFDSETLNEIRRDIILMAEHSAHVAVALSCVDIIGTLYFKVLKVFPENPYSKERDFFILSKGHGCMALYAVLAKASFFDRELLQSYGQNGSILAEHPLAGKVPGIEFAAGSLGHGLSYAAGIAKAIKLSKGDNRVFVLMGDGECNEGAVWEAAAVAAEHKLDNLFAIVDSNGYRACGQCDERLSNTSLSAKWVSFGWKVVEVDGHDCETMANRFQKANASRKPIVFICKTVKGKGVDFMENNLEWHYRPVKGEYQKEALGRLSNA